MSVVLHVDSSVRAISNAHTEHGSISKRLAKQFILRFKDEAGIDEYIYRDVGVNAPRFITQDWIGAVFYSGIGKNLSATAAFAGVRSTDCGGRKSRFHRHFIADV